MEVWKFRGLVSLWPHPSSLGTSQTCLRVQGVSPCWGVGQRPTPLQSANQPISGASAGRLPQQVEQALEQAPKGLNQDTNQRILHLFPPFWVHGLVTT